MAERHLPRREQHMTTEAVLTCAFYHVNVASPERASVENNLSLQEILARIAVPLKLRKPFLVDGYQFDPIYITRIKVRRTQRPIKMEELMSGLDLSSVGSALSSVLKIGTVMQEGEDVTNDILLQAEQSIAQQGLAPEPPSPVFARTDPKKVFIVSSFSSRLSQNFDAIFRACANYNLTAVRVDKEMSSDSIIDRIQRHLLESTYVIADLTDARPNVYYEIGYFDAILFARRVKSETHLLLIAQDIQSDAHFDLRHRGIEKYDNPYTLMTVVEKWLDKRGLPRG